MNSDNRIPLRVMGLSVSQIQQGAYALILQQIDGPIHIPVVIGVAEAQAIAMQMEKIVPPRPLTHDLFAGFARAFGVTLEEVFINRFEDGLFSAELTLSDGTRQVTIEARASDAIALAMRFRAPVYTTPEIMHETGFVVDSRSDAPASPSASAPASDDSPALPETDILPSLDEMFNVAPPSPPVLTDEELQAMDSDTLRARLDEYTAGELYELAARVAAELKRRSEGE